MILNGSAFNDNVSLLSVNFSFWMMFLSCISLIRFIMTSFILRISHVTCDDEKHHYLHNPHLVLQHIKSYKQKATAFLVQFFMFCPSVTATDTAEVSVLHTVLWLCLCAVISNTTLLSYQYGLANVSALRKYPVIDRGFL